MDNDQHSKNPDHQRAGRWELLDVEFRCAATHAALLPTNKVFVYGGSSLDVKTFKQPPPAEILDLNVDPPSKQVVAMEAVEGDLWCGGHTYLADGRLLFVGGTSLYPPLPDPFYGGLNQAYLFDPFTETWERLPDMQEGRWYPTLIRLPDNCVLAVSGLKFRDPQAVRAPKSTVRAVFELAVRMRDRIAQSHEILDPDERAWQPAPESRELPLYPRLHLLPDGDLFYSGVFNTHYFTPGRYPSARWDPVQGTWTPTGGRHRVKNREEGISVILALRPPDYHPQVLVAGGGHHNLGRMVMSLLHSIGLETWGERLGFLLRVQDSAERIDLNEPEPRWRLVRPMNRRRIHAVGVLLPDGHVLAVGGMSGYGHISDTHQPAHPVLEPEIYDPEADTWTLLAPQQRARVYHSTALLLPDGRVISMGGNPQAHLVEHSIEIYSPPYLFRGERPVILDCPDEIGYGDGFTLELEPEPAARQVVLMRPEVITHVTNTDQRLLELVIQQDSGGRLQIEGPPSRAHMPQGYCLLFALSAEGVPSQGRFVRLG